MRSLFFGFVLLFFQANSYAQNYHDICINNTAYPKSDVECEEIPRFISDYIFSTGYNGGWVQSKEEAVQKTIAYFTVPGTCSIVFSFTGPEVVTRVDDSWIGGSIDTGTEQPWKIRHSSRNATSGECEKPTDKFAGKLYGTRSANCFDPYGSSDSPERLWSRWGFIDVKKSACLKFNPVALDSMCPATQSVPTQAGNPIQFSTGNKLESESDISDWRPAPLNFTRIYNSGWANGRISAPHSSMGKGWAHNHEMWLSSSRGNVGIANTTSIQLKAGDHETFTVTSSTGEQFKFYRAIPEVAGNPDAGSSATGVFLGGRSNQVFERRTGDWQFTQDNGDKFIFNAQGQLAQKISLNGDAYNYSYLGDRLTRVSNQYGRFIDISYGANGWITQVTPSHGNAVKYLQNGEFLQAVQFADASTMSYAYEDSIHLTGKFDALGKRIGTYTYSGDRAVATQKAPGIENYSFVYQNTSSNYSTTVTTPLGEAVGFSFLRYGHRSYISPGYANKISSLQDEPIRTVGYGNTGLISYLSNYIGANTNYTWDTARRLPTQITEIKGSTTLERSTNITWHPTLRVPTQIVVAGRTTNLSYNSRGKLLSQIVTGADGSTQTSSWTYDSQDNLLTETDAKGQVTTHTYDGSYNRLSTTDAAGRVTEYTSQDSQGRVLAMTDAGGVAHSFTYDLMGRMKTQVRGGLTTTMSYLANGLLKTVTQPNGYVLTYTYDDVQRLVGWSDNRGNAGSYALDAMGNATQESIADANAQTAYAVQRTITQNNRLASETKAGQTLTYGYDNNGDLIRVTNGLNQVTTTTLDLLRRPTGGHNGVANFTLAYNAFDELTQAKDFKSVTTTYARDGLGNATAETSPDIGTLATEHDALGLPKKITDAMGRATSITRDALSRPTAISYADGSQTTLSYHLSGGLSQVVDAGVTTTYTRDSLGRVTQQDQVTAAGSVPAKTLVTHYSYVPAGQGGAGQVASITYPSGKVLGYQYDSTGLLTAMSWNGQPLVSNITWTPLGQPKSWTWAFVTGSAANATRSYNTAGQLSSTELFNVTWDAAARVSQIEQQVKFPKETGTVPIASQQQPVTTKFTYDAAGRLTGYEHLGASGAVLVVSNLPADVRASSVLGYLKATYSYDANGNRRTSNYTRPRFTGTGSDTFSRTFTLDNAHNKILGMNESKVTNGTSSNATRSFIWDAAGSLLSDGAKTFSPSARVQMASATTDVATTAYTYNSASQRVRKATGATSTDYVYGLPEMDMDNWPMGVYEASGANATGITEVVYLPTASGPMPIATEAMSTDGTSTQSLYAVHTDHLNTPRRVTSPQGDTVWQWVITGFGEMPATMAANGFVPTGDATLPAVANANGQATPRLDFALRYPGQVMDSETGLFYNHHRYYDPYLTVGYTQADPIGLEGGWNRFGYVGGNPLKSTDSLGLSDDALPAILGGGAAIPSLTNACLTNPWACGPVLAGAGGYALGTLLYPVIEGPVSGLIDWCMNTRNTREKKCDAQLERDEAECLVARAGYGRRGQAICLAKAKERYAQCLRGR